MGAGSGKLSVLSCQIVILTSLVIRGPKTFSRPYRRRF